MRPAQRRPVARGFTLVEVLVAIFAMAILSAMAWQGLEAVLKARDASRGAVDRAGRLATVLTQWEQDLQAVVDTGAVPALVFDGQTLRLTRRDEAGVHIVAWAVREGRWQRWASPAYTRSADLQQGWLAALQLLGTETTQLTVVEDARTWQVYFFISGNWANAQSTGNLQQLPTAPPPPAPPAPAASPPAGPGVPPGTPPTPPPTPPVPPPPQPMLTTQLPEAVRIVVTIGEHTLTRDLALGAS
jgi:general secretion pathway protein J